MPEIASMRKFAIVAGLVLAFTACKKNKWDKALSDMEGYKDKMCACKDKACADDVHKQYKDWQKGMMADMKDEKEPPKDVMDKGDKLEHDMKECRKKVAGGDEMAPPPPPAGGDTAGSAAAPPPAGGSAAAPAGGEAPKAP